MFVLSKLSVTAAAFLFTLAGPVMAHGTKTHEKVDRTVAADAEQMPWGVAGSAANVDRTIDVSMLDKMRFNPQSLRIKQGETIRFRIRNDGKVLHEFVLGTQKANDEHAALMLRFPGMEHDSPYMAHVAAGGMGEIIWQFNKPGEFKFACLIAGHYQAGMVGSLEVMAN
ncbi:MAG: cupredoxin domain-containing protein [Burkholderiaceae bacterium]